MMGSRIDRVMKLEHRPAVSKPIINTINDACVRAYTILGTSTTDN